MQLQERRVFQFTFMVEGGMQFNFSVMAEDETEAMQQLKANLEDVVEELDTVLFTVPPDGEHD